MAKNDKMFFSLGPVRSQFDQILNKKYPIFKIAYKCSHSIFYFNSDVFKKPK